MRGSELVRMVLERAGKQLSTANEAELRNLLGSLEGGHDSMKDGIDGLSAFLTRVTGEGESGSDADDTTDAGDADNPADPDYAAEHDGASAATAETRGGDGAADGDEGEGEGGGDRGEGEGDDSEPGGDERAKKNADEADSDDEEDPDAIDGGEITEEDEEDEGESSSDKKKRAAAAVVAPTRVVRAPVAALTEEQLALIEAGREAREEAIEDALHAAARAFGVSFDEARYRRLLDTCRTLADIRQFRDDWQAVARAELGPIGRFTPEKGVPGGGHWDATPTGQGGRQTVSRDPSDPAGLIPAGARPVTQVIPGKRFGGEGRAVDPDLYRVDGNPSPSGRSRRRA